MELACAPLSPGSPLQRGDRRAATAVAESRGGRRFLGPNSFGPRRNAGGDQPSDMDFQPSWPSFPSYSVLSAATGSASVARRAGTTLASSPTLAMISTTEANTSGS